MSKKNIPTEMPSASASVSDVIAPAAQPLLSASKMENGKSGGSVLSTPFDSISQFEIGQTAEEGIGAGVWVTNKKVVGVWTVAQTRNAWVNISDLGWKKFYSGSDS